MDLSRSTPEELTHPRQRTDEVKPRESQWSDLVDLLDDKIRWLQYNLHKEKGERMRVETELIAIRRVLGPSSITLFQERLNTPALRVRALL